MLLLISLASPVSVRVNGDFSKRWGKAPKEASEEEEDPEAEASGDIDTVDLLDREEEEAVTSSHGGRDSDDDEDNDNYDEVDAWLGRVKSRSLSKSSGG